VGQFGVAGVMASDKLKSPISNYYVTDPISRASATMAKCTAQVWSIIKGSGCGCKR
jgi:hypothetical protein